jgi:hypothetical protein
MPFPDIPPPPTLDRHPRGEGGAAHGGRTSVVQGSGSSAGRTRDSQASRPLDEVYPRAEGGAAFGGHTASDQTSEGLASRETERVSAPVTARNEGAADSLSEQALPLPSDASSATVGDEPTDADLLEAMKDYDSAQKRLVAAGSANPTEEDITNNMAIWAAARSRLKRKSSRSTSQEAGGTAREATPSETIPLGPIWFGAYSGASCTGRDCSIHLHRAGGIS